MSAKSKKGRQATNLLIKKLRKQGFVCELTRNGHWKVSRPGREGLVTFGSQPHTENLNTQTKLLVGLGFKP